MSREEIRETLGDVLRTVFGWTARLSDELGPPDIERWDSLTHVTLVFAIEKRFGVKLTGAEIAKAVTVGDFINLIVAKSAGAGLSEARR